jgi:electron transfer flavoprotein alpha subunit
MRAIVLVKQVPDLRLGGVGVRADGTIDRSAAPPITNPADLHAVEAAVQLADEVWVLSMGPLTADDALREAITAGANRGVLLCDRLLAGSDTWATANALAATIRWLGGADVVLCGMSALDGETGQVGPSVAQRLGWPQATGCESLTVEGSSLIARRIVEGGFERLRMPLPAVVSVSETGYEPRYPSLPARRRAVAATIEHITADDVGLRPSEIGLVSSPTKVARMTAVPWPERNCRYLDDGFGYDDLVSAVIERGAFAGSNRIGRGEIDNGPGVDRSAFPDGPLHGGEANLWVVCQTSGDGLDRASRELLSKATELAPALGGGVGAVVLTAGATAGVVDDAGRHGADVVYLAEHPSLVDYLAEPFARVVTDAVLALRPDAILLAATTAGRDLAPRIASMLGTGLAADCTDLYVDSWTRLGVTHERLLHMVRPAMAGGVLATCLCPEARPQMATVRPGVFAVRTAPRRPRVVHLDVNLLPIDRRVELLERRISPADVDLRDADVVIAGGAGCDSAGWHLVEELSESIGGRVAASRGAVEAGLAERSQQVGQTGATIRPRLYVACGISGALQHAVGMQDSATIVAINRDPQAVVFRLAHFGIVADTHDAIPQLIAAFRRHSDNLT